MLNLAWPPRLWAMIAIPALVLASCGLLGSLAGAQSPAQQRHVAQQRWQSRPFTNYRIAIRVEYGGNACAQELETEGEYLRRIVMNNCRVGWIGLTTVTRLFEISALLDRPTPCYSSMQSCACYRVRQAAISYDPQLGFPTTIAYRREVQPNVTNPEYWRRLWDTRRVPRCGPANYNVVIAVTSLRPLA